MTGMKQLSQAELDAYRKNGYHIERRVFRHDEMQELARELDGIAAAGKPIPWHWTPDLDPTKKDDPLARYPRVMAPHKISAASRRYYIDPRLKPLLESLLDDEPVAIQSMFYWKPPGARGQAFHQDNYYARIKPTPCIAGWVAVDPSTPGNGGLYVVPGTQNMDIQCPEPADSSKSFYPDFVRIPAGLTPVPAELEPGDVLFFEGNILHGSNPNYSKTMWRRSHVCHYMPRHSTHASQFFLPALTFDGDFVSCQPNGDVGPCGGPEGSQATAIT